MYGDIVILNITENMNEGKTMEYFNWFAKYRKDNYMVKLDDDSFIHLIHYYRDLQDLPRERAYYGNALNAQWSEHRIFMAGMFIPVDHQRFMHFSVYFPYTRNKVADTQSPATSL
ncbi:9934_t:CDS:2 [Diversispora eburnea]|uniref:9934_t:CDS:1 n=1 Tax=Diversispora eburnea TaxID=1213867 RepID=A0A9N9CES1_9GLOM|nr:9934_t:CDS:2 [Diversispora eburnea]